MSRFDTLRQLVRAEIPTDLDTIEATATEIVHNLPDLEQQHALYWMAHHRINLLLDARDGAIARRQPSPT